jgi:aryl-alcohol dehydrogenase-like predicted oxidoreductase
LNYIKFFNSDIEVSRIGFGTWALGGQCWGNIDDNESGFALQTAIDTGINLIDTAPVYGIGHAETIVGKAIKGKRDKVILSSKCGILIDQCCRHSLKPENIRIELDASLKRLDVDYIDIYFCHCPDLNTPVEETMAELLRCKADGKIRSIGLSNHPPELVKRAMSVARIDCVQDQFSLLKQDCYRCLKNICCKEKTCFLAYGPLGGGILTGKYSVMPQMKKTDVRKFFYPFYKEPLWSRIKPVLERMNRIATEKMTTMSSIAIAWILAHTEITSVLAGDRNSRQVIDNSLADKIIITENEIKKYGMLHITYFTG